MPGMKKSQRILLIAAILVGISAAVISLYYLQSRRDAQAQASGSPPELLSQLPPGAFAVIFLDLDSARKSRFYQDRPDHSPLTIPDRDYASFIQATGFDFEKDLDRALIAFWPQVSPSEKTHTIILAEGRFDRRKIHDYAMRVGKIDRQQGRDVFLFPADNAQSAPQRGSQSGPQHSQRRWNTLVFLDDRRVAIIDGTDIAPLLAVHPQDSASDPLRERVARVAGASAFAVSRVPAIPDNFAFGGMQSATLANMIRSVQWITLAALPQDDTVRVSLEGECNTDSDAKQLESTLEVLRVFGQAGLASPKTRQQMDPVAYSILQSLMQTAEISQSGDLVRVHMELTENALKSNNSQKTH
jgi:hypothetical protein